MSTSLRRLSACAPGLLFATCLLLAGCDSAPATSETKPAAPPATSNVAQAPTPAPKFTSSVGDRYPMPAPIYDPAVQQANHQANPSGSTAVSMRLPTGGRDVPGNPKEEQSISGIEDVQVFEQPNIGANGGFTPPTGRTGHDSTPYWAVPSVRPNPLPHSP